MVVFRTLGAAPSTGGRASAFARRRASRAQPGEGEPEAVPVTRVDVIGGRPLDDERSAKTWLERCKEGQEAEREVGEALRQVNKAVHAHRLAAGDPYAADVARSQARRIRLGYGTGDELMTGQWHEAYSLPPERERSRRRRMLAPQEQVAAILGGRHPARPSEDLLLRARLDLEQGRTSQAALQARVAHGALQSELRAEGGAGEALEQLRGRSELLSRLATTALERPLDREQAARLDEVMREMERIARRRRHGLGPPSG